MKVCFVPYPIVVDPKPDVIDSEQLYPYLPLGILTLSSMLEQAGHEVFIIDPVWEAGASSGTKDVLRNPDIVAHLIHTKAPDLVGFSTICGSYPLIIKWAESSRHLSAKTPILLGGPQATATDEQTLRAFPWIDTVLRGEAENSIVPFVNCLQSEGNLASVLGLTWRSGSQVRRNPDVPLVNNLDNLPLPAYHLLPMEKLVRYYNGKENQTHPPFQLEAGRGCPFNCSFCSTGSFFQHRYRTKTVGRLVDEMITLNGRYGLERFGLAHDLFTCDSAYVLEFCRRLRETGLNKILKWECSSRIDTVNPKILSEMAEAGCTRIFYGIETGSQRIQKLIGKNLPIQRVKSVIQETHSLGIRVATSFICGFPQEKLEDLSATFNLAVDMAHIGVEELTLHLLSPLSGSELYQTFKDTMCYDSQWSEIPGKYFSKDEQELVRRWPDIFASFYHFGTPFLNYDMLRAFSNVVNRCIRLLAALSASDIDMMTIFECWPEWYNSRVKHIPGYYYTHQFLLDFLQFLRETLTGKGLITPDLADIIRYHAVVARIASYPKDTPIEHERFNSDVLALMQHLVDGKPLKDDAYHPTTYLFWKTNEKIFVKRLTPEIAELLEIPQSPDNKWPKSF